jgi:hypothetical protein
VDIQTLPIIKPIAWVGAYICRGKWSVFSQGKYLPLNVEKIEYISHQTRKDNLPSYTFDSREIKTNASKTGYITSFWINHKDLGLLSHDFRLADTERYHWRLQNSLRIV